MLRELERDNPVIDKFLPYTGHVNKKDDPFHTGEKVYGYFSENTGKVIGLYFLRSILHDKVLYDSILKCLDKDNKIYPKLLYSIMAGKVLYRCKFAIDSKCRGEGTGYKIHIESLKKENLSKYTEYVILLVDQKNMRALNMHMKSNARMCGIIDGSKYGYGTSYIIYYKIE